MSHQNPWSDKEVSALAEASKSKDFSKEQFSKQSGRSVSAITHKLQWLRERGHSTFVDKPEEIQQLIFERIKKGAINVLDLAREFRTTTQKIEAHVFDLSKTKNVIIQRGLIRIDVPAFGAIDLDIFSDNWQKYGLVADTHLACKEERLDALHACYDIFEQEGIKHVFHAGNMVDGYIQRINNASAIVTTPDGQAQYVVDNYPVREGITTYYITGDDHEGWWIKDGFNWGYHLQNMARDQGRTDLVYLGHVEADIKFRNQGGVAIMKIQHPGGGSSYARSYTGQKQVEAFQGGEKPHILVQGHYHVNNYMLERNVHVIGLPGFQDQTVFARKKKLRMDVGGGILHFKQNPKDGSVVRLKYELIPFFDRKYYQNFLRSDKLLLPSQGLVLTNGQK
jgi:hypothetical protein